MNSNDTTLPFDPEKFEAWVLQLAECDIADEDLARLLRMTEVGYNKPGQLGMNEIRERQLKTAIHAFCHTESIRRGYRDEDVDLETSRRLIAKRMTGERYNDEELRLLGKRGSNPEAQRNLRTACWDLLHRTREQANDPASPFPVHPDEFYRRLTDEQFRILAESVIEQIVVRATNGLTDIACWVSDEYKCPDVGRRLDIAYWIGLYTEDADNEVHRAMSSPKEREELEQLEPLLVQIFGHLPRRPSRRHPSSRI